MPTTTSTPAPTETSRTRDRVRLLWETSDDGERLSDMAVGVRCLSVGPIVPVAGRRRVAVHREAAVVVLDVVDRLAEVAGLLVVEEVVEVAHRERERRQLSLQVVTEHDLAPEEGEERDLVVGEVRLVAGFELVRRLFVDDRDDRGSAARAIEELDLSVAEDPASGQDHGQRQEQRHPGRPSEIHRHIAPLAPAPTGRPYSTGTSPGTTTGSTSCTCCASATRSARDSASGPTSTTSSPGSGDQATNWRSTSPLKASALTPLTSTSSGCETTSRSTGPRPVPW